MYSCTIFNTESEYPIRLGWFSLPRVLRGISREYIWTVHEILFHKEIVQVECMPYRFITFTAVITLPNKESPSLPPSTHPDPSGICVFVFSSLNTSAVCAECPCCQA